MKAASSRFFEAFEICRFRPEFLEKGLRVFARFLLEEPIIVICELLGDFGWGGHRLRFFCVWVVPVWGDV